MGSLLSDSTHLVPSSEVSTPLPSLMPQTNWPTYLRPSCTTLITLTVSAHDYCRQYIYTDRYMYTNDWQRMYTHDPQYTQTYNYWPTGHIY